jgi:TetR/AcrR family transcriptional regulator, transcriptional repressor for nem operon
MKIQTETRDRLVMAARDLFWQQGYAATGIAEILRAADAGSGSLYYFFPTKEDLLLAVLQWYRGNLWPAVIQPVFERVSDPIERVFGILDGYRQGLLQTKFRNGCPVGNLALELSNSHPAARQLIAENFSGWRAAIQQCLEAAAGRLPAGCDPAQLALFVLTTMEGAVMLARAYHGIDPYDTAVTSLRDYFDRLLADGTDWARPKPRPAHAKRKSPAPGRIRRQRKDRSS